MPALGFGRDKEKFCQLFQKLRVVGRSPTVYQGCGGEATAFPYTKKGGTYVPLLFCPRERSFACGKSKQGATAPAPGAIACGKDK